MNPPWSWCIVLLTSKRFNLPRFSLELLSLCWKVRLDDSFIFWVRLVGFLHLYNARSEERTEIVFFFSHSLEKFFKTKRILVQEVLLMALKTFIMFSFDLGGDWGPTNHSLGASPVFINTFIETQSYLLLDKLSMAFLRLQRQSSTNLKHLLDGPRKK